MGVMRPDRVWGSSLELGPLTKTEARAVIRDRRRDGLASISPQQSQTWCETLGRFLDQTIAAGRWVVVYDAMGDEIDLQPLIDSVAEPALRFALTRTPDEGFELSVHPWGGPIEQHPYGYHQPAVDALVVADGEIGAVLVPALAFDHGGNRLGRGKGYYDRFLARLGSDVVRVGMTAGLIVDRVPVDAYDVTMTHLAAADRVVAVTG